MAVLPMFPLGSVLFPGAVLPLHVFEPRYRRMVRDCLEGDREFGVVLIERGSEVGGGDQRTDVGTVARLAEVVELDDGRYALVAVGTRRIRIASWLPDDPYPVADVENWPEELDATDDELAEALAPVLGRLRRVLAMAAELGEPVAPAATEVSDDPVVASYHVSALAPLGPADHQRLLAAPGPARRLALLADDLADAEARCSFLLG